MTVQAAYLEAAKSKFATIDLELTNAFKKIGSTICPLTSNDTLVGQSVLHSFRNNTFFSDLLLFRLLAFLLVKANFITLSCR